MHPVWVILALIFVVFYVLSPIDGLPDMVPLLGWLDDTALVGILIYFLRTGRLPGFLSGIGRLFKGRSPGPEAGGESGGAEADGASETPKDPYEILGIMPGATRDEIQAAYRAAAQQYHPDKVAHLGAEFQELAKRKFLEIQEAYAALTREKP